MSEEQAFNRERAVNTFRDSIMHLVIRTYAIGTVAAMIGLAVIDRAGWSTWALLLFTIPSGLLCLRLAGRTVRWFGLWTPPRTTPAGGVLAGHRRWCRPAPPPPNSSRPCARSLLFTLVMSCCPRALLSVSGSIKRQPL